jgi:DNA-binding HxlR family transcriptional regulator
MAAARTPRPGTRVRGSTTGRPIMALLDLLGRRAALRVLWELRGERLTFRALAGAADTNPSVLNTRLGELRASGLVDHDEQEGGYGLTADGRSLLDRLAPLHAWAEGWARRSSSAR